MNTTNRRCRHLGVALGLLLLAAAVVPVAALASRPGDQAPTYPPGSPSAELAKDDLALIGHYEAGKKEAVAKLPLVMLVSPGEVTTIRHGVKRRYFVSAQADIDLKACAHSMLGFYGVLQPVAAGNDSEAQWNRVRAYRKLIATMPEQILNDPFVPAGPAAEATRMLRRLYASSGRALERRSETHPQLVRDEREVRATVTKIFLWSGNAYARAFLKTVREIKAQTSPAVWHQAWAVTVSSPAASRDNLETAIMIKTMGPGALGHRLFLSQNTFTEPELLAAISGMYYDQTLSRAVFGNAFRLWRDVFAPIATALTGFTYYPQPADTAAASARH
jgi:hypothetical protein